MARPLNKVKEVRLIERMSRRFKTKDNSVVVSIGDDAAVVRGPRGRYLLYTADMLIESVHFKKGEDYDLVGYKAMAASISDIAAMGGLPKYALVTVGLPGKNADKIVRGLSAGISRCAKKFGVAVIGGDTNRSDRLIVDCFVAGEIEPENVVLRSTAKPGDFIFVSGSLGGSQAGRHLTFEPRVKEARFLVKNFKVNSMIDLSDGLAMDLNRMARASRLGALIFENKIPFAKGVLKTQAALYDGEDYELLFTLSRNDAFRLFYKMTHRKTHFKFFPLGRMTDLFEGVKMVTCERKIKDVGCDGFQHF